MSESLRKELAGTGVKVTNVLPGVIVIISVIITINSITNPHHLHHHHHYRHHSHCDDNAIARLLTQSYSAQWQGAPLA